MSELLQGEEAAARQQQQPRPPSGSARGIDSGSWSSRQLRWLRRWRRRRLQYQSSAVQVRHAAALGAMRRRPLLQHLCPWPSARRPPAAAVAAMGAPSAANSRRRTARSARPPPQPPPPQTPLQAHATAAGWVQAPGSLWRHTQCCLLQIPLPPSRQQRSTVRQCWSRQQTWTERQLSWSS